MKEYLKSFTDVLDEVKTSTSGLSTSEANTSLETNGKNKLAEGKKDSLIKKFLSQLADPMIIILIIAAIVSTATDWIESGVGVPKDALIILFVVIVNALIAPIKVVYSLFTFIFIFVPKSKFKDRRCTTNYVWC